MDAGYRAVHVMTRQQSSVIAASTGARGVRVLERLLAWRPARSGGSAALPRRLRRHRRRRRRPTISPISTCARMALARSAPKRRKQRHPGGEVPAHSPGRAAACDPLDGVEGRRASKIRACARSIRGVLACSAGGATAACLTPAQVDTVRATVRAGRDPRTAEAASCRQVRRAAPSAGGASSLAPQPEDNALDLLPLRRLPRCRRGTGRGPSFDEALDAALERAAPVLDAVDPDLPPFVDRGGKLLLYHGWGDPQTPPPNTHQILTAWRSALGALPRPERAPALHGPGMGHCDGGDRTVSFDKVGRSCAGWSGGSRRTASIAASCRR